MEVIIQQTIMCSIVVLAAFYIGKFVEISGAMEPSHKLGQTMAFLVLGWSSILHIFVVRSRISVFKRSLFDNPQLVISAGIMFLVLGGLAAIPVFRDNLGFVAMDGTHWLLALGLSIPPMIVAEYGKFWDNYKYNESERTRVAQQKIH
jgi:magnesium-transporting ATPase (P-type)